MKVPSHQNGEYVYRLRDTRFSKAEVDTSVSKVAPVLGSIILASAKDIKTSVIMFYGFGFWSSLVPRHSLSLSCAVLCYYFQGRERPRLSSHFALKQNCSLITPSLQYFSSRRALSSPLVVLLFELILRTG